MTAQGHLLLSQDDTNPESWRHLIEAVKILWGPDNQLKTFEWTPWAEAIVESHHKKQEITIGGSPIGKTQIKALLIVLNWLIDPENTVILVCDKSTRQSNKGLWGAVEEFYLTLPEKHRMLGNLNWTEGTSKLPKIKTINHESTTPAGIYFMPVWDLPPKDFFEKTQGIKADRVLLVEDNISYLRDYIRKTFHILKANRFFKAILGGKR